MKLTRMQFNPFGVMTYVLWHEDGKDAFVVDPGMMDNVERERFSSFITSHELKVKKILLTHVHIDHVPAVQWVKSQYSATIECSQLDEFLIELLPQQYKMFMLPYNGEKFSVDRYLDDGEELSLNGEVIKVLHVPGHSPGSLAFYLPECDKLLSGDAVFYMSIGRTDLPGGSYETLILSIKEKIMTLPEDTVIYPGHGDCTTVADEKCYNPYLR